MIGISAFKALPEIPGKAIAHGYRIEFTGLVDPLFYSDAFLSDTKKLHYFPHIQSAHGPFYDLMPGSSDPEVARLAGAKFDRAYRACSILGVKKLVLHTGWIPEFYPDDRWIANSVEFWKKSMGNAPEGLVVCLENNLETSPYLVREIIHGVGLPTFRACLDIGHVHVHSDRSLPEWIRDLGPLIEHVHLHNNFGERDTHHGLLNGSIEMPPILDELAALGNPRTTWNMEIRSEIDQSLEFMNRYRAAR